MADQERYYDCRTCTDKNCKICPACGRSTILDATDSYRKSVKAGYYTSGIMSYRDSSGKIVYGYTKPGE